MKLKDLNLFISGSQNQLIKQDGERRDSDNFNNDVNKFKKRSEAVLHQKLDKRALDLPIEDVNIESIVALRRKVTEKKKIVDDEL